MMNDRDFENFITTIEKRIQLMAKIMGDKDNPEKRKRKRVITLKCGKCDQCKKQDCGMCKNCLDKPKFGGHGLRKKGCDRKTCFRSSDKHDLRRDSHSDSYSDSHCNLQSTFVTKDIADDNSHLVIATSIVSCIYD